METTEAIEAAEAQIDAFVAKRIREADEQRLIEESWKESVRRQREERQRENREAWAEYHVGQAERLERTAAELAEQHRQSARALEEE